MGVGAAPAESPPVLRGLPRYVRDKTRPIQITVAASDPILLAVAPGELALTSGEHATRNEETRRSIQSWLAASPPLWLIAASRRRAGRVAARRRRGSGVREPAIDL